LNALNKVPNSMWTQKRDKLIKSINLQRYNEAEKEYREAKRVDLASLG